MRLALLDLNARTVLDVRDFNPEAGLRVGLALAPIVESVSGAGEVKVGTVDTIVVTPTTVEGITFPRRVARVTTWRAKTQGELDAEKDQVAVVAVASPQARIAFMLVNGLFRAINDERAARAVPLPPLTRAEFIAYAGDNRPAAQTISQDQFAAFVRGLF